MQGLSGRSPTAKAHADMSTGAVPKKLRILFQHRTASKDGQAVHIAELTEAFRRRGHEVIFVGPPIDDREDFGGDSRLVRLLRHYLPKSIFELLEFSYSLVMYWRLAKAYRRYKPDVLYERFNLFLLAGSWLRRRYGVPFLLEVNAPLYQERRQFGGLVLQRLARYTQERAWRDADMVLPVTRVLADYVRGAGVPEQRITVIHNGINPQRFLCNVDQHAAKARLGLENNLVLGFTGFIREWHGLAQVVDLLAEADPALRLRLLLVGEGPGRVALLQQAADLGVADMVHCAGLVARDSIPDVVSAFDVALQPAATPYASPLKIFEYMALGRAIVAPRQPNIEEILTDNETALLFAPDDLVQMRERVAQLCGDVALRHRIGLAARQAIIDRDLTWDGNARRVEHLVHGILADRRAAENG
jgi:glycosyltransferase involved in cell wall biosynthesis